MKQHFDLRVDRGEEKGEEPGALKVVFMGTSDYGGAILSALLLNDYQVRSVVTQPDRKSGRKNTKQDRSTVYNAVADLARTKNIPLHQPEKIDKEFIATLKEEAPDVVVVASYGRILPAALLTIAPRGFINVHGSLLPKLRGASPIQNAILYGLTETGTTIIQMDDGMDTGAIIAQKACTIDPNDTSGTLFPKMAEQGAALLIETLPHWFDATLEAKQQDNSEATLCQIIEREDGHIQWTDSAADIYNRYRALMPWLGIFSFWKKTETNLVRIKFFDLHNAPESVPVSETAVPGEVFIHEEKVYIVTGDGAIVTNTVQQEGRRATAVVDFCNGNTEFVGTRLQ